LVFTGLAGAARVEARPEFVGEVALETPASWTSTSAHTGRSAHSLLQEHLERPEVRDAVRERLGHVPAIRVASGDVGEVVIRSRATSPQLAMRAASAFATSFVDVQRGEADREIRAAAQQIQQKIDQFQVQIDQADGARRDTLLQQHESFVDRLDQLQRDTFDVGPQIIGSSTARSTARHVPWLWSLAALGVLLVGANTIASRRGQPG
jgi:hypothetical protein